MPGMDGMELLRQAKKLDTNLPVLMITAWAASTGQLRQLSKVLTITLPSRWTYRSSLRKYGSSGRKEAEPRETRLMRGDARTGNMSPPGHDGPQSGGGTYRLRNRPCRASNFAVIIQGNGTGKNWQLGPFTRQAREQGAARAVDCGAIPETLFESELFGYEKGGVHRSDWQRSLANSKWPREARCFLDENWEHALEFPD